MANVIGLISKYLPILDEKYQWETKSSVLDAPADMIRETEQAKTILIPKMSLQGLGDYSKSAGFVNGDATLEWVSHTFTQDRGRSFSIDAMDNAESAFIAFGRLAGEFIRLHVGPELDAYRFSKILSLAGTSVTGVSLTKTTVLGAIDTAAGAMDDAEVPEMGRILFLRNPVNTLLKDADGIQRRLDVRDNDGVVNRKITVLDEMQIVKVPTRRFKSAYDFYDGTTGGQEAGGFVPAVGAVNINFLMVHPSAILQIVKHAKPRVFDPDTNQAKDAWKFDYRIYHDLFVPDEKTDGIYAHTE